MSAENPAAAGDLADFTALCRRLPEALADPPPRRLPDAECDRRAAVTLLVVPGGPPADPPRGPGGEPDRTTPFGLFVHRARVDGDPWSGHVALPGGRHDPADADLVDTARREMEEETGIRLPDEALLGRLDDLHPRTAHLPSIAITPFVAALPRRPDVEESHELAGHLWIPLPDLAASARRSLLLRELPAPREFPTIEYAGAVIWGLTFAIVENFLERLGARPPGPPPGGRAR
ncbi:MAG: CoA pyrophosphatase [Gemmatimonadota bacterium]|nr:CoA pyrophosphatase [Gemmatimonadota bacterium]